MSEEINFCKTFADRVADKQGFELKVRYQLEQFFYDEGWASHTNPKNGKEGFSHQYTYNDNTIKHFIEDMVRWSALEFQKSQTLSLKKIDEEIKESKKPWNCSTCGCSFPTKPGADNCGHYNTEWEKK